jgi:hypothetical protein
VLDEFYRIAFRKRLYASIEQLQADLDEWLRDFNEQRTHQGRWCLGKNAAKNSPRLAGSGKREDGGICGLNAA